MSRSVRSVQRRIFCQSIKFISAVNRNLATYVALYFFAHFFATVYIIFCTVYIISCIPCAGYMHPAPGANDCKDTLASFFLGPLGDHVYFYTRTYIRCSRPASDHLKKHTKFEIHSNNFVSAMNSEYPTWLNEDFVKKVLRFSGKDESVEIISLHLSPATKPGDNYTSLMFRAEVDFKYENNVPQKQSLIVKVKPELDSDLVSQHLITYELLNPSVFESEFLSIIKYRLRLLKNLISFLSQRFKIGFHRSLFDNQILPNL